MTNIYLYQNYLIRKLTKLDLKILDLDSLYNYDVALLETKKYKKLMNKINLLNIELNLVQHIIKEMESMYAHMVSEEEQMLECKNV
jgi:hypothetical protein